MVGAERSGGAGELGQVVADDVAVLLDGLADFARGHELLGAVGQADGLAQTLHGDLDDLGPDMAERVERGAGLAAHVVGDLVVPEVHRPGDAQPGDAGEVPGDGQLARQRGVVERVRPRHDVGHQRRVGHRAGHRPDLDIRVERSARPQRHAAVGWLVADHAALARRLADRAGAVAPGCDGRGAGGERGGRTARRATRRGVEAPRVARHPPEPRVGGEQPAELGTGGAGEQVGPGAQQPLDGRVGGLVDGVLVDARAVGGAPALDRRGVLDHQRQPLEAARPAAGPGELRLGRPGAFPGLVEVAVGERVDRVDDGLGAAQHGVGQLDRRQAALAEPRRRLAGAHVAELGIAHRLILPLNAQPLDHRGAGEADELV